MREAGQMLTVIDFSKVFNIVLHGRLLTKISETGVELRVVKLIKNFLSGHLQRVRIDGHLSQEVRVNCIYLRRSE
jgi:ribosomal protein L31E